MLPRSVVRVSALVLVALLSACTTIGSQIVPTALHTSISLKPGELQRSGIAFLTPSTVTGQEQDKQTLALIFGETMSKSLPSVHVITLPETLGAINRVGLADDYRKMIDAYRDTGIFPRELLREIGKAVGARYLAQLKLASFSQDMSERFSLLGFRLFQTLHANIRLYLAIWDSEEGTIAWESVEELSYAYDSGAEKPVTFRTAVEETARQLISRLP